MSYIIVIIVFGIYVSLVIRGFIDGIIFDSLNTSARKKRSKKQSLKEWFLFSRFNDVIPRFMKIGYYGSLISIGLFATILLIMQLIHINTDTIRYVFTFMVGSMMIFPTINYYRFCRPRTSKGWDYSSVIIKRRNKK